MCVCVRERERERESSAKNDTHANLTAFPLFLSLFLSLKVTPQKINEQKRSKVPTERLGGGEEKRETRKEFQVHFSCSLFPFFACAFIFAAICYISKVKIDQ